MLIHSISSIIYSQGQQSVCNMSDQSDSQNLSEQQVHLSEGPSPSSSSDDGSRSTPSNLPKAATRQRKKRTSDSEDENYVAEEEVTSKRAEPAAGTKPGLKIKRPAGRTRQYGPSHTGRTSVAPPSYCDAPKREREENCIGKGEGKFNCMRHEANHIPSSRQIGLR